MNKRHYILTIFMMVVLLLTACTKREDSTVVSTPQPTMIETATPMPTEEPLMPGVVALENINPLESDAADDASVSETPVEQQTTDAESADDVAEEKPSPTTNVEEANPTVQTTPPNVEGETIVPTPPISLDEFGHIENSTEYERYNNMSGEEQVAFMESFESPEAFVAWYNAAEAEFNAETAPIIIGADATVNLGNLSAE